MLNPWLWLGILLTGIVGVYAWEYRQNPGQLPWQLSSNSFDSSDSATSTNELFDSLSPEEQSVAAELDNIELLLAQLDSDVSALTTGGEASAAASLNATSTGVEATEAESTVERLNRYIDEYRFFGTDVNGSNFQPENNPQTSSPQSPAAATVQPSATGTAVPLTSALAEAFARQQATQPVNLPTPAIDPSRADVGNASGQDTASADSSASSGGESLTFSFDQSGIDQTGVVPGSLNGLNRAFIRTTPNMSPPPGTTGYVPPTSLQDFNRLNQAAGVTPFPTQSSAGSFNNNVPSVNIPERSQVLPPAQTPGVTPQAVPTFDGSAQTTPNQPRNAWEALWD